MLGIINDLQEAIEQQRPLAWCRLVETRGSTPQKAGAVMLVFENGEQAGTLGGGCVEAEVKRTAIGLLQENRADVVTFQLNHDYGWDDGLICGGRMTVLIQPVVGHDLCNYFEQLATLLRDGEGLTEAISYDHEKSALHVTASVLFNAHGEVAATMHCTESDGEQIRPNLRPTSERPRAYVDDGIAFLPQLQRCRLIIVGGGHVGQAVAALASDLDFEVWVTDDRQSIVSEDRFPRAERRIAGACQTVLPDLEITPDTYCLIVTRGHSHDQEALFRLVGRGARYLGMIGSRRKIRLIFDDLLAEGISPDLLDEVHAPVGIDIGSQTVPEIAISIAAELVSHRNCNGHVPGRPERIGASQPSFTAEVEST